MLKTPSIAQLPNYNAYPGFGFVMVMQIVPMVAMRLQNYVVSYQTYLFMISYTLKVVLKCLIKYPGQWRCHEEGFKCIRGNPSCINSTLLCDGLKQCSDGSDEESCGGCEIIIIRSFVKIFGLNQDEDAYFGRKYLTRRYLLIQCSAGSAYEHGPLFRGCFVLKFASQNGEGERRRGMEVSNQCNEGPNCLRH